MGANHFLQTVVGSGTQQTGKISPVYPASIPNFEALPTSITAAKFAQPTKVEYFPNDDFPEIDLKGHTVEELAVAAQVSVEVIQEAIKVRQQQLMHEKKNFAKQKSNKSPTVQVTQSYIEFEPTEKSTTQSTTTRRSTTLYTPPKKKVTKKPLKNGHKVRFYGSLKSLILTLNLLTGHECTEGILSGWL